MYSPVLFDQVFTILQTKHILKIIKKKSAKYPKKINRLQKIKIHEINKKNIDYYNILELMLYPCLVQYCVTFCL